FLALGIGVSMALGAVGQNKPFRELVWSDEFNGQGTPDPKNWTFDLGSKNNGWGNQELQFYTNKPENVRQQDGVLVIDAIKKEGQWTSARIKTQGKFGFTYGRVEFKAKLTQGVGTWPALWLLGESITTKGWPACGEIDVMEYIGRKPDQVQSVVHTPASHGNTINLDISSIQNPTTEFHLFATEWSEKDIKFYVDNKLFYTYAPPVINASTWPFTDDFFIIINLAIGGNLGSEPSLETEGKKNGVDSALTHARFEVDYVRVYQTFKELSLTGPEILPKKAKKAVYKASTVPQATYKWTLPAGAKVVSGQGTSEVTINWGKKSGKVHVQMELDGQTHSKTMEVKIQANSAGNSPGKKETNKPQNPITSKTDGPY
ncbi:MAG: family 16 glycosylhydrolase, partial [Rufibacter sp.]